MSISILNRGASSGLTSIIRVNGLGETDTVTASNGDKIKRGVWVDGHHEITGIKDLGAWTVTATNGAKTATQDVLIEVIGLYEIEMDFLDYLYKYGTVFVGDIVPQNGGVTLQDDNIFLNRTSSSRQGFYFSEPIDVTEYDQLSFLADATYTGEVGIMLALMSSPSITTGLVKYVAWDPSVLGGFTKTEEVLTMDVSQMNGTYYVAIFSGAATYVTGTSKANIYKVWRK